MPADSRDPASHGQITLSMRTDIRRVTAMITLSMPPDIRMITPKGMDTPTCMPPTWGARSRSA